MTTTTTRPMPGHVLEIPVEHVHPDPDQPRTDLGDLAELTESVRAEGVLIPLLVRADPDRPGEWLIVAGERRHAAATAAGMMTVPAISRDAAADRRLVHQLVENDHRLALTPLEEADAYHRLVTDHDMTQADVARRLGRSEAHVSKRLALRALPPIVTQALADGHLTLETAGAFAALDHKAARDGHTAVVLADLETGLAQDQDDREAGLTPSYPVEQRVAAAIRQARAELAREEAIDAARFAADEENLTVLKSWHKWQTPAKYRPARKGDTATHAYIDSAGKLTRLVKVKQPPKPKPGTAPAVDPAATAAAEHQTRVDELRAARLTLAARLVADLDLRAQAEHVARWLILADDTGVDPRGALELLDTDPGPIVPTAARAALAERAAGGPETAVRAAFAAVLATADLDVHDDLGAGVDTVLGGWREPETRAHFALLETHGYDLDPIEATYLTTPDRKARP